MGCTQREKPGGCLNRRERRKSTVSTPQAPPPPHADSAHTTRVSADRVFARCPRIRTHPRYIVDAVPDKYFFVYYRGSNDAWDGALAFFLVAAVAACYCFCDRWPGRSSRALFGRVAPVGLLRAAARAQPPILRSNHVKNKPISAPATAPGYGGAVVYAREPTLDPADIPALSAAAKRVGLDWKKDFIITDNSCPDEPELKVRGYGGGHRGGNEGSELRTFGDHAGGGDASAGRCESAQQHAQRHRFPASRASHTHLSLLPPSCLNCPPSPVTIQFPSLLLPQVAPPTDLDVLADDVRAIGNAALKFEKNAEKAVVAFEDELVSFSRGFTVPADAVPAQKKKAMDPEVRGVVLFLVQREYPCVSAGEARGACFSVGSVLSVFRRLNLVGCGPLRRCPAPFSADAQGVEGSGPHAGRDGGGGGRRDFREHLQDVWLRKVNPSPGRLTVASGFA